MTALAHLVTADEARLVRWIAREGAAPAELLQAPRIFLPPVSSHGHEDEPIGIVEASGRSRCRECGELLAAGTSAIAFGFDVVSDGTPSSWGALRRAYLHPDPCQPEETR